ncbi:MULTISPECIES: hypothetical protein [Stenotrophomonas]|uniref:Lipoprotein n=1 Tax=Stenotrophomonas maltophilia TaxID=40324 RepID=A0A2J0SM08_STEMA|nr:MULTISPECIES: hypothetical protein [Stenotrophomonas]MBA0310741.1 hypothetical protein [Stenotrophomonas maltophilia]MBH1407991.1 hypothetical protein [Stenotrophomonas maltophilia]MBH1863714.1 hypothetical protein [Stenotrophomonas maltophilia]MDH1387694.1 hypothetical protein [Stenotrophomonas sp. GD03701]MDH1391796.1 hypothetical protein [Stenotrophomonas sp. GD03702]
MKVTLAASALACTLLLSGCTTSGWLHAASGVMDAKDAYEKQERLDRINRANAAAARARSN